MRCTRRRTAGARGSVESRSTAPSLVIPAYPPVRATSTTSPGAGPDEGAVAGAVAPAVTPTAVQASATASACSLAAATVAAAKVAKSLSAGTPEVSAAYQIRPAPLHDSPPIAC